MFGWFRPEAERYYNFTELAAQLNEMEEGLAPTDSRKRPDQRMMEDGRWDEANEEKLRLEEKQRAARRQRELEAEVAVQEGIYISLHLPIFPAYRERYLTTYKMYRLAGQVDLCLHTSRSGFGRKKIPLRVALFMFLLASTGIARGNKTGPFVQIYFSYDDISTPIVYSLGLRVSYSPCLYFSFARFY